MNMPYLMENQGDLFFVCKRYPSSVIRTLLSLVVPVILMK